MTGRLAVITGASSVDGVVAAAREAEAAGIEAVLVGEGAADVDATVAAAAVLLATGRVRCGPGVATVADRHPVALARAAATLDRLAPGRALLGIGRGDDEVVRRLGRPLRGGTAALADSLAIAGALLRGEAADHDGEVWSAHLGPLPARARPRGRVPLLLAAVGPRTLTLGGAAADGVILNWGSSPAYVESAVRTVAAGARAAGRSEGDVDVLVLVHVVRTDRPGGDADRERVRAELAALLALPGQGSALAAAAAPGAIAGADLGGLAACGDAAAVTAHLRRLRDAGARCAVMSPQGLRSLLA